MMQPTRRDANNATEASRLIGWSRVSSHECSSLFGGIRLFLLLLITGNAQMFKRWNADDVINNAVAVGSLSQAAAVASRQAVAMSRPTGVSVAKVKANRLMLMQVVVDDSGSMAGFEPSVFEAFRKLKTALCPTSGAMGSQTLISVHLLNRGMLIPYTEVEKCPLLDSTNYRCDGGTPLYTTIQAVTGTMLVKCNEVVNGGRTAQTFTVVISDGAATDAAETDPATVRAVLTGLSPKEHIVSGIAIGGAAEQCYANIGITPKWILDPARKPKEFDAAMQQIAVLSQRASQSSAAFQAVAQQGLANQEFR
jgi:hypothetical protein